MNFLEAVKSGKKFRRPGRDWYYPVEPVVFYAISKQDMLATDWEVEEKKVEITYEKLYWAMKDSHGCGGYEHHYKSVKMVAKELGLID